MISRELQRKIGLMLLALVVTITIQQLIGRYIVKIQKDHTTIEGFEDKESKYVKDTLKLIMKLPWLFLKSLDWLFTLMTVLIIGV